MEISSKTLLQGETPRLIDEWQTISELWDTIRNEVDKRGTFSQFILTGSTVAPRGDAEFLEVFLHCLVNCQIVNEHAKLDKGYCRKRTEIIMIFIISVL